MNQLTSKEANQQTSNVDELASVLIMRITDLGKKAGVGTAVQRWSVDSLVAAARAEGSETERGGKQ